eukprot:SAG31_NODE_21895_length_538_cov_0.988610_1_plen_37_part_10
MNNLVQAGPNWAHAALNSVACSVVDQGLAGLGERQRR